MKPTMQYPAPEWLDPAHVRRAQRDNAKSLVPASLPPGRAAVSAVKETPHGLIKVAERLLLDHLAAIAQPWIRFTGHGELPTLLHVPGRRQAPRTPPRLLLNRQVPHITGVRAMPDQYALLFATQVNTISRHTNTIPILMKESAT